MMPMEVVIMCCMLGEAQREPKTDGCLSYMRNGIYTIVSPRALVTQLGKVTRVAYACNAITLVSVALLWVTTP